MAVADTIYTYEEMKEIQYEREREHALRNKRSDKEI